LLSHELQIAVTQCPERWLELLNATRAVYEGQVSTAFNPDSGTQVCVGVRVSWRWLTIRLGVCACACKCRFTWQSVGCVDVLVCGVQRVRARMYIRARTRALMRVRVWCELCAVAFFPVAFFRRSAINLILLGAVIAGDERGVGPRIGLRRCGLLLRPRAGATPWAALAGPHRSAGAYCEHRQGRRMRR
jgi:hypothetical protein